MKLPALLLTSSLLLAASSASAQATAPSSVKSPVTAFQVRPSQEGTSPAPPRMAAQPSRSGSGSAGQSGGFGNPKISEAGNITRLLFDLPQGMTYTLVPTFGGLRIDVGGVSVVRAITTNFSDNLAEYRATEGQVILGTPYPLSLSDGWSADELALANGTRVLVIELGPQVQGGASSAVRGRVLAAAPLNTQAQQSLLPPQGSAEEHGEAEHSDLPPGDSLSGKPIEAPAPPAPLSPDTARPSDLVGRVPGTLAPGASVGAPRIGKNPGVTRLVFDLPPGTGYRIVPGALGLRVELLGVSTGVFSQSAQNTSPEIRSWRYEPSANGVNVTVVTGTPMTSRSGWRALLLPPISGSTLSRLAVDIAPALANLTPLQQKDRVIAAVPPLSTSSGLAIASLTTTVVRPRVVLDAGHGGKDPGAIGSVVEKEVTLAVAKRVRDLLTDAGVDVIMTRETDTELHPDKNTDLIMRAQKGTPGTQLFVSIHVNAMAPTNVMKGYGVETWWLPNHVRSYDLASQLQGDMVRVTGAFNRGIKGYRSLSVLRNSRIPAALVEIGFTSHPVDGQNLTNQNYLERVAVGIATGIRDALVSGATANGPQQQQRFASAQNSSAWNK